MVKKQIKPVVLLENHIPKLNTPKRSHNNNLDKEKIMAHRKHLSQEGHAEPEKNTKKAAKIVGNEAPTSKISKSQTNGKKGNAQDLSNPHIIDEHGEY